MDIDCARLDASLAGSGLDGYLIDDDGENADARYLAGFGAPDPFVTLYDGDVHLLVSGLEYGRAQRESRAESVSRLADYDYRDRVAADGKAAARTDVIVDFLAEHGVTSVAVGERFPVGTADGLRNAGITVSPDHDDTVGEVRAVKTEQEVEYIRETQRANEAAMATAEELLATATVEDGTLHHDGEVLTSERVKRAIERTLLEHDCSLDDTIVACGADGADPHDRGSGPLQADELIVVDIFPRHKETRYFADMTRTFVRGAPTRAARDRYDITARAQQAALDVIEPGVTGRAVHDAVCDIYEDAGYDTLRANDEAETGFIHGTGHGLGLDIHEAPRLSLDEETELEAGHVVTVEPGLYDPAVGGVRIEDLVVVTPDGHENLTAYPTRLTPRAG
jgi:Xaa-Pro aminopeptidase